MPKQDFLAAQNAALAAHGVTAEQRFVEIPVIGGHAQVLISGSGPPMVFLNGVGTPAAMFAPLMGRLDRVTCIAVDLPGFGLTDPVEYSGRDFRCTAVDFLHELLDALDLESPLIVGNSLGSLWASWLAIAEPSRVSALVHVGCPALVLDTSAPLPMRLLSVPVLGHALMRLKPPSERQVEELARMVREDPLPPEIARLLLATERLPGFERTFLTVLNALLTLRGARAHMSLGRDQLTQIQIPTLLVFAKSDPMGGEETGRKVEAAMPDAHLEVVEGGHAPWIHNSKVIAPIIQAFADRQHGRPA